MFKPDEDALRYSTLPLERLFVSDYLPAAKGDYVKVYLYALLLSQTPGSDSSPAALAQELSLAESEVEAALRYWERRRLLVRLSDEPREYCVRSAALLSFSGGHGLDADSAYVAFSEDVYALFGDRRKIRPAEIALAWEWVQDVGLPQEVVLMLLSHMIESHRIHFKFTDAQRIAMRMKEENAVTVEDAEAFFVHSRAVQDGTKNVLARLGKRRTPSLDEMNLYQKWLDEWQYTPEAILDACSETTKGEPTFAYLDGILGGIRRRGEKHGEAPRTGAQMRSHLAAEKEIGEAAAAFARSLGLRSADDMVRSEYARLCAEYEPELILLVAREVHKTGGRLDSVERWLEGLRLRGISSAEDARPVLDGIAAANAGLNRVFEALGHRRTPTKKDRELYRRWTDEWGFDEGMLILAAEQAREAEQPLPYINKILQTWHEEGVKEPGQAAKKRTRPTAGRQVSAQQYTQRDYSEEELERRAVNLLEEASKENE